MRQTRNAGPAEPSLTLDERCTLAAYVAAILRGAPEPSREQIEAVRNVFRPARLSSTVDRALITRHARGRAA